MDKTGKELLLQRLHELKNNNEEKSTCIDNTTINNMINVLEKNDTNELKTNNIITDYQKLATLQEGTDKYRWLSTVEINEVMSDIEQKSNNFKYLGTVPNDFYTMDRLEINKLDYKQLIDNQIHKIGIVINTHPHYKSGAQWVAMFTNFDKGLIFYYDTSCGKPSTEVKNFIKLHKQFMENDLGMEDIIIKYNEINCEDYSNGIQCILFLKHLA